MGDQSLIRGCLGTLKPKHWGVDTLNGQGYTPTLSQLGTNPPSNKQGVGTSDIWVSFLVDDMHFRQVNHISDSQTCSFLIDLGGSQLPIPGTFTTFLWLFNGIHLILGPLELCLLTWL